MAKKKSGARTNNSSAPPATPHAASSSATPNPTASLGGGGGMTMNVLGSFFGVPNLGTFDASTLLGGNATATSNGASNAPPNAPNAPQKTQSKPAPEPEPAAPRIIEGAGGSRFVGSSQVFGNAPPTPPSAPKPANAPKPAAKPKSSAAPKSSAPKTTVSGATTSTIPGRSIPASSKKPAKPVPPAKPENGKHGNNDNDDNMPGLIPPSGPKGNSLDGPSNPVNPQKFPKEPETDGEFDSDDVPPLVPLKSQTPTSVKASSAGPSTPASASKQTLKTAKTDIRASNSTPASPSPPPPETEDEFGPPVHPFPYIRVTLDPKTLQDGLSPDSSASEGEEPPPLVPISGRRAYTLRDSKGKDSVSEGEFSPWQVVPEDGGRIWSSSEDSDWDGSTYLVSAPIKASAASTSKPQDKAAATPAPKANSTTPKSNATTSKASKTPSAAEKGKTTATHATRSAKTTKSESGSEEEPPRLVASGGRESLKIPGHGEPGTPWPTDKPSPKAHETASANKAKQSKQSKPAASSSSSRSNAQRGHIPNADYLRGYNGPLPPAIATMLNDLGDPGSVTPDRIHEYLMNNVELNGPISNFFNMAGGFGQSYDDEDDGDGEDSNSTDEDSGDDDPEGDSGPPPLEPITPAASSSSKPKSKQANISSAATSTAKTSSVKTTPASPAKAAATAAASASKPAIATRPGPPPLPSSVPQNPRFEEVVEEVDNKKDDSVDDDEDIGEPPPLEAIPNIRRAPPKPATSTGAKGTAGPRMEVREVGSTPSGEHVLASTAGLGAAESSSAAAGASAGGTDEGGGGGGGKKKKNKKKSGKDSAETVDQGPPSQHPTSGPAFESGDEESSDEDGDTSSEEDGEVKPSDEMSSESETSSIGDMPPLLPLYGPRGTPESESDDMSLLDHESGWTDEESDLDDPPMLERIPGIRRETNSVRLTRSVSEETDTDDESGVDDSNSIPLENGLMAGLLSFVGGLSELVGAVDPRIQEIARVVRSRTVTELNSMENDERLLERLSAATGLDGITPAELLFARLTATSLEVDDPAHADRLLEKLEVLNDVQIERLEADTTENRGCSVCLDPYRGVEDDQEPGVVAMPCKHVFHKRCLRMWLLSHSTCPICRHDINPHEYTPSSIDVDPLRRSIAQLRNISRQWMQQRAVPQSAIPERTPGPSLDELD